MKHCKLALSLFSVCVLLFSLFSCAGTTEGIEEGYLLLGGERTTPDWILRLGDGDFEISFSEYRHFYLNAKSDLDLGQEGYFDEHPEAEAQLKETVLSYIRECYALESIAAERGISLTADEQKELKAEIESTKKEYGDELYVQMLNDYYLTESVYQTLLENNLLYDKTYEALTAEGGEISVSDDELASHLAENYVCYAQIYIDFRAGEGTNSHEQTDQFLSEVTARLEEGDLFYAVAFDHSDDQTMMDYRNGYLKEKDALNEDVLEVILSLEEEEVSEPLLTGEGYYIFRRMPISDAVITENREYLLNGYEDANGAHVTGLLEDRFYQLISEKAAALSVTYADCYESVSTKTLY